MGEAAARWCCLVLPPDEICGKGRPRRHRVFHS